MIEAVIGAIYLDSGISEAKDFIHRYILSDPEHKQFFYDAKTILQEEVQKENGASLHYELVREDGPEHDKTFVVEVMINGVKAGSGTGHSKKAAEQQAAYEALLQKHKGFKAY